MVWVDHTPIWVIGFACMIVLISAHELGYSAGRRFYPQELVNDAQRFLVALSTALASLLMAFTFGAAQTDFAQRHAAVSSEANAIATAYLHVQLLDRPARDRLGPELLQYAEVRAARNVTTASPGTRALNRAKTARQQMRIWALVGETVRSDPVPSLNDPLLQSVDEMFRSARSRAAAQDIRVPPAILLVLVAVGIVGAALIGFSGSASRRYPVILGAVLLIEVLAFCLILALDRPDPRAVWMSQRSLDNVLADIRQSEAVKGAVGAPDTGAQTGLIRR